MSRRRPARVLGLMLVVALLGSAFVATSADAKRLSKAQKHAISKKLMRAVKKNPNVVSKRWFLKQASVVSFTLPTTIRLLPASNQGGGHVNNDDARLQNNAVLDLGPSLGSRTIGLGGTIHANINFNDAFDGGALGDVKLSIPADSSQLTSTSVPLLANTNTSDVGHPAPEAELQHMVFSTAGATNLINVTAGTNTTSFTYTPATLEADLKNAVAGLNESCTGAPPCPNNVYVAVLTGPVGAPFNVPAGFQAATITWTGTKAGVNQPQATASGGPFVIDGGSTAVEGNDPAPDADGNTGCGGFQGNGDLGGNDVDLLSKLQTSRDPGNNNNVGPGPSYGGSTSAQDTVLRTGALKLGIAPPGVSVDIPGDSGGTGTGINSVKIGSNGGRANLFGNAVNGLGSGNSVDVTVNLTTDINSIARQVDGQWPQPAGGGTANEPNGNISANFFCRQAWTGKVTNYLTGINLIGNLKISPAITADGKVRIAKVNLHSKSASKQALAACLSPYQLYLAGNPLINALGADPFTVAPQLVAGAFNPLYVLGGSLVGSSAAPTADCNSSGGPLNRAPFGVAPIPGGSGSGLEKLLTSGAAVGVSGDLTVPRVRAEVLIGSL